MYVCVCNAVTERQIHHAAKQGARNLRDLRQSLGVTAECGRCARCAHDCLRSAVTPAPHAGMAGLLASITPAFPVSLEAT